MRVASIGLMVISSCLSTVGFGDEPPAPKFTMSLPRSHPWRPPFGLNRVGRRAEVRIEASARPVGTVRISEEVDGKAGSRREVSFPDHPPFVATAQIDHRTTRVSLLVERAGSTAAEQAALIIDRAPLEAEAIAEPSTEVNPVDLGTILVPAGWLLLGPGQEADVDVAALARDTDQRQATLSVRFGSQSVETVAPLPLTRGETATAHLRVASPAGDRDRDTLVVAIIDGKGSRLWTKDIPVMIVRKPPDFPSFGATYTKLRYDAPISVRDPATGSYSSLPYEKGWDAALQDVVVTLPNGGRFVFWRGSSYIPFWAGRHNTGACYEWAEVITRREGAVDCVEPLMDKELKYSRVEIVESTPSRVHIRWTYESTDLNYKVWGDQAVEDYYFYPDGFGTRVVTLKTDATTDYELCEFIILTPQGTFPFDVLPENLVDAISLDGSKRSYRFPLRGEVDAPKGGTAPAVFRLHFNRHEDQAAIAFNPGDRTFPKVVFGPFEDNGQRVTPCYWGSHWPLARGNATGSKIDDRVGLTPCHNSVMSWAGDRPEPISERRATMIDTLGRSRPMEVRRWVWMIGMSNDDDTHLVERARSFATPPSLKLEGAEASFDGYAIERRAIRLRVQRPDLAITVEPTTSLVDPILELDEAPRGKLSIRRDGNPSSDFAWDGRTLWLHGTFPKSTRIELHFENSAAARN